jgi:acyl-CoA thioester hydrolase
MRSNELELLVNFGDTDRAGIVYYPNYFKWFDIATHHFFRSMNMPLSQLEREKNIILPIIDVRSTFEKPLHDDDWIVVKTSVEKISTKTIQFNHELFLDDERVSYGYELRGWVLRSPAGRLAAQPIPDEIRALLIEDVLSNPKNTSLIRQKVKP